MLEVKKISVSYLGVPVIREVSFKVEEGQMVSIVGSNGAGKSTILKTISGLLRPLTGEITFLGKRIDTLPPYEITSAGISHIPEGRKVFAKLSVLDNLLVGAHTRDSRSEVQQSLEEIYTLFSILKERKDQRGETLSGGEQQMLAIARGLMSKPKLMMLDEPSLGLMPSLSVKVIEILKRISSNGTTILLVEQKVRDALELANRAYVLQTGAIVQEGTGADLLKSDSIRKAYLGM
ncbi:MAG: amino acid/amide transporter ATP-binding protein 2, family [Deltaproteobacteria bacterium]|nr:amino acid/amide transporter ATP-binding protein 2, family [Deltaproteobacteria bacterium]MBP1717811.1 amino acid/amide transporter ATP-binding protein 2, family [Deltaproteobacteria bacterium]